MDQEEDLAELLELKGDSFYSLCVEKYNKPIYEDVTAMINSSVPTLIDGDALLLYAVLHDSHPIKAGNQFLHITYLFERFLDMLTQKGVTCVLVFFEFWELVWEKNFPLRTLRFSMYHHFKNNTNIPTYRFTWYYSKQFEEFKLKEKPRCMLSSLAFDNNIELFNKKLQNDQFSLNLNHGIKLFASGLVHCISTDLPIIDIDLLNFEVTLVNTFNLTPKSIDIKLYIKIYKELITDLPPFISTCPKKIELSNHINCVRDLIIEAASYYLKTYKDQIKLKLLFLYYAVQFTLSPENRAPPKMEFDNNALKTWEEFISNWHECLFVILYNKRQKFDCEQIADLWQGTLFLCILNMTTDYIENKTQLGLLHIEYESLISDLNLRYSDLDDIDSYPIEPVETSFLVYKQEREPTEMVKLSKVDNPLINKFCINMFDEVFWENPASVMNIRQHQEVRHWHSRRPIDEPNLEKASRGPMTKTEDRQYQKSFRYNNIYGQNLEGRMTEYDAIIYKGPTAKAALENDSEDKKDSKKKIIKKQSNSSIKLQEKIQAEKAKKALENDKAELKNFKEKMYTADNIQQLTSDLHYITKIRDRMSNTETVLKASILKLKIHKVLASNKESENKINHIKQILLLIRSILKMKDKTNKTVDINPKDQKYISRLLHLYGFKEIAQENNLPLDETYKEEYKYNFIRFQMEYLGADLLTEESAPFDPDINFAPDKWQIEFIEAIRRNESALVVAPTSSGKTFASYYCMKRVLQYSPDGIVVYVAPTKALVNQVAATVTHRFKRANLANDGSSLVGIFTRDHRQNPISSRILITVPQCLDILLLSPSNFEWAKKVEYVIFDEIHRLSGNEEGLVWERLLLMITSPFLALSATISDSNLFYKWLQSIQEFKKEQDKLNNCLRSSYEIRCVIHEERHADLLKYVYTVRGGLQHYHPYCALHPKVLLDRKRIPESITLSPKETLQLYDALSKCAQDYIPPELNCLEYFNKHAELGFLTRKSVRDYEKELGKLFYKIYKKEANICGRIIKELTPPNYRPREDFCLEDGRRLLHHMADNNMLPAIVFSYNRSLVEEFCHYLLPDVNSATKEKTTKVEKVEIKLKQKPKGRKKESDHLGEQDMSPLDIPQCSKRFPINILCKSDSKFKGIGLLDSDDLEFIENRLYYSYLKHMGPEFKSKIIAQLQSGLAYHHAGVNKRLRDTAEMLFRLGVVRVVVATGTLAVGVHMPCKSVVIYGDSPFINSLEFHQMSGRAGRRGFDNEGNVIFLNLTKKRHDMLMTDKLPKMLGNYPINISLVVRLLLLVAGPSGENVPSDEYTRLATSKALTLLENSLLFEIKPYLKQQIKLFVGFVLQLLLMQEIITLEGLPTMWSSILIHLHYHEPANLALVYLIRTGALSQLVESTDDDKELQWKLVVVLAHLFTRVPIGSAHLEEIKRKKIKNSVVTLDPLPECIEKCIDQYNKEIMFVFNQYFLGVARHLRSTLGSDNTLPLSKLTFKAKEYSFDQDSKVSFLHNVRSACYQREITSAFVALSGNVDNQLNTGHLISNIRPEFCPEIKIVPDLHTRSNLNGYALDFYRHGSSVAIRRDNKLRQGFDFNLLKDFCLILKAIVLCMEDFELEGSTNARLLDNFRRVSEKYYALFENEYYYQK